MKVVQINITGSGGSTGKICAAISGMLTQNKIENYILYSSGSSDMTNAIRYEEPHEIKLGIAESRLVGNWGFEASGATRRLIRHLEQICPDVVHLHNIHAHNADLSLLFPYLTERGVKVFWTFHDCWAFTGYCPHYTMAGCSRWQSGCGSCPQKRCYSWLFDRSAELFRKKKELITRLDPVIITPSAWLRGEVKKSFLSDAEVHVIHNGIDLSVFQPRKSDFREKYGLQDAYMILGVAFGWGRRKGLDVFIRMAEELPDRYRIVLVGTDDAVDRQLPDNIISIHRTADQRELAEIYTAADVFVNPTREENFPTVHMEALACGTPVATYNSGGSPECINEDCGIVVEKDDAAALMSAVRQICEEQLFPQDSCTARASSFDNDNMLKEYWALYQNG